MTQQQPHEIIWTLSTAAIAARCIQLVADLGVADRIGEQPVTIGGLASSSGANPDALDRVLRLLTAYGVFEREAGAYRHTSASP